jgi:hypothetical protein
MVKQRFDGKTVLFPNVGDRVHHRCAEDSRNFIVIGATKVSHVDFNRERKDLFLLGLDLRLVAVASTKPDDAI